jgi:dTDP-glucose 4,6-dehydratase
LESIVAANDKLGVNVSATLLSRDPKWFSNESPHLALRPEFDWLKGEPDNFVFPAGRVDHIIHLATPSAAEVGAGGTALMLRTLAGTARLLELARHAGAQRFLLTSSGAVYGKQPPELSHVPESYSGAPDLTTPASAYGEIKRMSELMCAMTEHVECVVARGFAFVGPYLPLGDKFAIGSFIRDAIGGGPIRITGNGSQVRSYMYAADLAVWLLTFLIKGKSGAAYNLGSDHGITLAKLATAVGDAAGGVDVQIQHTSSDGRGDRYVPAIEKAQQELGLDVEIDLSSSLHRTLEWARGQCDT